MVRRREVEPHSGRLLDSGVVVERCAIVRGHRLEAVWGAPDQHLQALAHPVHAPISKLSDPGVARLSLDQGGHAVLVLAPDHGIDLPVSDRPLPLDGGWTFRDVTLSSEPAATVIAVVALAPKLRRRAKVEVQTRPPSALSRHTWI